MSILLISDVHLCHKKPNITNEFLHFLNYCKQNAQALYILGDLFDKWVGDDELNLLHESVAIALQELNQKKIPCYFIHGNHDFLLGNQYANLCKMKMLPAKKIINLSSGKRIIILHGDTLCTNDHWYQLFRKYLQYTRIQQYFLTLPLSTRLCIFNFIYSIFLKTKKYTTKKNININIKKVIDILNNNQAEIMIHGHTHQIEMHHINYHQNSDKKTVFTRITLGNWNQFGSVIEINEQKNKIILIKFPLNKFI